MLKKTIAVSVIALTAFCNTFAQPSSKRSQSKYYKDNIVRFYPLTIFNNNLGVGIDYERIVNKAGTIGVSIPMYAGTSFMMRSTGWNYPGSRNNTAFFLKPGVKFYPFSQRKVTYSIGLSATALMSKFDYQDYMGNRQMENHLSIGMMVNNAVQFNLTKSINIGLELGFGPSYVNKVTYPATNVTENRGMGLISQFSFHVGYRF